MITPAIFCCLLAASTLAAPAPDEDGAAAAEKKPEVRAMYIHSNIKYRYAETVIRSMVVNPASTPKEYIFHVVLPEEAFITGFVMTINEKDYPAHVGEKEEAKKEYNEAVASGLGAAHVAYNARDSNEFKININIEPAGKVWFNLTYEDFLARSLGVYEHKINVNPGQIVDNMKITVNIEDKSPIINVKVPELKMSNEITSDEANNELAKIERESEDKVKITWAPSPDEQRALKNDGVSGQFIVKYDVDRSKNAQQILVNDGYFVHFYSNDELPPLNKHVVFILDLSGSMAGTKMSQLKTAMNKILSDLKPTDFFSIVLFSNTAEAWTINGTLPKLYSYFNNENNEKKTELTPAHVIEANPENVENAKKFIDTLDDMGGTNIISGLRTGLSIAKMGTQILEKESSNTQPKPIIVFLTDGEPNVEESNPSTITELATTKNDGLSPIYSLGFGVGADMKFLRNLSLANNAFARHIYEASDAALQLEQFFKMISSPLLSDVKFEYVPEEVAGVTKSKFFSMNAGEELVVAGRLNKDAKCATAKMTMKRIDGDQELIPPPCILIDVIPLPPTETNVNRTFGPLEKLWAYKTIKQLLDNHTLTQNEEVKKEALELALKYSFVTPLTSLVVVKPNETSTSVNAEKSEKESQGLYGASFAMAPAFPAVALSGASGGGGYYQGSPLIVGGRPPAGSFHPGPPAGFSGGGRPHLLGQMLSFPGSPGGYHHDIMASGHTGMVPVLDMALPGGPIPPPSSPASFIKTTNYQHPHQESATTTISGKQDILTLDYLEKIDVSEVTWLNQNVIEINGSSFLKADSSQPVILDQLIALNKTSSNSEVCVLPTSSGHCLHFAECVLNVFSNDIVTYDSAFKCSITDTDTNTAYLGVCCPDSLNVPVSTTPDPTMTTPLETA